MDQEISESAQIALRVINAHWIFSRQYADIICSEGPAICTGNNQAMQNSPRRHFHAVHCVLNWKSCRQEYRRQEEDWGKRAGPGFTDCEPLFQHALIRTSETRRRQKHQPDQTVGRSRSAHACTHAVARRENRNEHWSGSSAQPTKRV